ncbi:hypothetical protein DCC79_10710 [bacterium]|nr:MAG: hypothetical protein DCC79_10710 [bacterium]
MQAPPEKLGAFYLGAEYDVARRARAEAPVVYDARDLTTHAVCIGMTGSGKTGLCIGLLEEAGLDRVPAILIDPKGDITNLLLQFPELRPEDFRPWVNADDARRKGQSLDDYAAATAEQWRTGLADWGIAGDRIRALQGTVAYTIYTPGSDAGVPVNILGSLAAPDLDWATEAETLRERIGGTVAALLGLIGSDADPTRSREAVLLANLFEHHWRLGQDLDLATLITAIQSPPLKQLGVFDVDTFYPPKDRFALAMAFNALVAAPAFQAWLQGEPLDIDALLYAPDGKPRHSIFYLAHLSDSERMFIVTLLLEGLVTWMRRQSGTTSLRALAYFDEVFGFFPPSAEPPSKRPLLTLLKQARAVGLGMMLVTQNPVDLDYKGLTNAGTWFIGKLQAERDKERVLAGLEGAIAAAGAAPGLDFGAVITQLGQRVFLLHNVHADGPVVFHTRWAMSYLRGPLTKPQVGDLMAGRKAAMSAAPGGPGAGEDRRRSPGTVGAAAEAADVAQAAGLPDGYTAAPAELGPTVPQVFVPVTVSRAAAVQAAGQQVGRAAVRGARLVYEPAVAGIATVRYIDRKLEVDTAAETRLVGRLGEGLERVDWGRAEPLAPAARDLLHAPESPPDADGRSFGPVPDKADSAAELKRIAGDLADWLYAGSRLKLTTHGDLGVAQKPGESDRDFMARLQQAARERRDAEIDKVQDDLGDDIARVAEKIRREEAALARDEAEASARKQHELVNLGAGVLGMLFGRRRGAAGTLNSALTKRRMTSRAAAEVEEGREQVASLAEQKAGLEAELQARLDEIARRWDAAIADLTTVELAPRRSDIDVQAVALAWLPEWWITLDDGVGRTVRVAAFG